MSFQKNKKVLFIIQAGHNIGLGHLYRMENLMGWLPAQCKPAVLILKEQDFFVPPVLEPALILNSFSNIDEIPPGIYADFSLVIVDIYDVKETELRRIRNTMNLPVIVFGYSGKKIENVLVVNVAEGGGIAPDNGTDDILEGPDFFITNDYLNSIRDTYNRRGELSSILCVFGGTDPSNLSQQLINLVPELDLNYNFDIISNNFLENHDNCANINVIRPQANLPSVFNRYDLLITSPGNIYFEAHVTGIPVIAVCQSKKQEDDFKGYPGVYEMGSMKECLSLLENIYERAQDDRHKINPGARVQRIIDYIDSNCR